MNNLIEKLDDKSAVIGIVGLGYVGLPLMLRYVESDLLPLFFSAVSDRKSVV